MSTNIEEKVKGVLAGAFPGGRVVLERLKSGKIIVTVVSAGFDGVAAAARKAQVRAALQQGLTEEEGRVIVNVLADTPEEHAAIGTTTPGSSPLG